MYHPLIFNIYVFFLVENKFAKRSKICHRFKGGKDKDKQDKRRLFKFFFSKQF